MHLISEKMSKKAIEYFGCLFVITIALSWHCRINRIHQIAMFGECFSWELFMRHGRLVVEVKLPNAGNATGV